MTEGLIRRPLPAFDPAKGLLHNEHFQIAYVTNDMAQAEAVFRDRFGVTAFRTNGGANAQGGYLDVRAVWIGTTLFELLCARGPGLELYTDVAPEGGPFVMKLHHFGYLVRDEADWAKLEQTVERGGWTVRNRSDSPGMVRAMHVEAPELGHLLEFVLAWPQFRAVLEGTPVA